MPEKQTKKQKQNMTATTVTGVKFQNAKIILKVMPSCFTHHTLSIMYSLLYYLRPPVGVKCCLDLEI